MCQCYYDSALNLWPLLFLPKKARPPLFNVFSFLFFHKWRTHVFSFFFQSFKTWKLHTQRRAAKVFFAYLNQRKKAVMSFFSHNDCYLGGFFRENLDNPVFLFFTLSIVVIVKTKSKRLQRINLMLVGTFFLFLKHIRNKNNIYKSIFLHTSSSH